MINNIQKTYVLLLRTLLNDPYELNNRILHRKFLIKTFEEINQELKKNNRQFRIDFDNNASDYFHQQNYDYLKKEGCLTDNDGLLYFKTREELYALDLLIKNNTNNLELKLLPKKNIKSKLPIYRIGLKDLHTKSVYFNKRMHETIK